MDLDLEKAVAKSYKWLVLEALAVLALTNIARNKKRSRAAA